MGKYDVKKSIREKEKWIWVEGYKGTDENMICRDYQFELGKQFDMDCDDDEIVECTNGFHLCKELKQVFNYYKVGDNNRYFKVKALVKKSDYDYVPQFYDLRSNDKLVAKSIIFEEEVSEVEVLKAVREYGYSYIDEIYDEQLKECRSIGVDGVVTNHMINVLIQDGYSRVMAEYLIKEEGRHIFKCAHALGSMTDMSMDTKIKLIFARLSGNDD